MFSWLKRSSSARSSSAHSSSAPASSTPMPTIEARPRASESGYDDVTLESGTTPTSSRPFTTVSPDALRSESYLGAQQLYPPAASTSTASLPPSTPAPYQRRTAIPAAGGYPSLRATFARLHALLAEHSPALLDSLAPPLVSGDGTLASLLAAIAPYELPRAVADAYAVHDGQDRYAATSSTAGLVYGLYWLPMDQVEREWRAWRRLEEAGGARAVAQADAFAVRLDRTHRAGARPHPHHYDSDGRLSTALPDEPGMASFPEGWVRKRYSHPGWLPLLTDRAGNYIGVDLDPPSVSDGGGGAAGQVIAFGREIDEKVVLCPGDTAGGFGRFLAAFVDDLAAGSFATMGDSHVHAARARSSTRDTTVVNVQQHDDDEESSSEEDGLGELDYYEGGERYGAEGGGNVGSETHLWRLRPRYRRWLASNRNEGGVVAALAERSRQQWRAAGIGGVEKPSLSTLDVETKGSAQEFDEPSSAATARAGDQQPEVVVESQAPPPPEERTEPRRPRRAPPPPAPLDLPTTFDMGGMASDLPASTGFEQGFTYSQSNLRTPEAPYTATFASSSPTFEYSPRALDERTTYASPSAIALVHSERRVPREHDEDAAERAASPTDEPWDVADDAVAPALSSGSSDTGEYSPDDDGVLVSPPSRTSPADPASSPKQQPMITPPTTTTPQSVDAVH